MNQQYTHDARTQQQGANDPHPMQQQQQSGSARSTSHYTMAELMVLVPPGVNPHEFFAQLPRSPEAQADWARMVPDVSMGC